VAILFFTRIKFEHKSFEVSLASTKKTSEQYGSIAEKEGKTNTKNDIDASKFKT
jgi:hypothetical protein